MTIPPATDRLIFRDWTPADVEAFHAICSDPDVMRYIGDGSTWSLDKTRQWIDRHCEMSRTRGYCLWALVLQETATVIGFCGFAPADDDVEIGWRLAKSCWGRGLASEAARTVLKHGFDVLGFERVIALVQSPNNASIGVCKKLGMQPASRFERNGRDVIVYAIGREKG